MWYCKLWFVAIAGGMISTLVMTMLIIVIGLLLKQRLNVPATLGAMMTGHVYDGIPRNSFASLIFGWAAHFIVGIVLSLIIAIVLESSGDHSKIFSLLSGIGIVAGIVAGASWAIYLCIYRVRLDINFRIWTMAIFVGHQVFTWLVYIVYLLSYHSCS